MYLRLLNSLVLANNVFKSSICGIIKQIQGTIIWDVTTLFLHVKSKAKNGRRDQTSVSPCDVTLRDAANLNASWTSLSSFCRVYASRTWGRVALSQTIIVPLHSTVVTKSLVLSGFYLGLRGDFVTFSRFRKLRRPEISLTCWFTGKFRFIFLTCKQK